MELNALDLSRLQFAFTVSFHIIFPAVSIGLASFIAVLEGAWLKTGKLHYKVLCCASTGQRSSLSDSAWAWSPAW
jgi:cytochrome d ubiquinol oxidase subunit I